VHQNEIEEIGRKLGFDNCFADDREGRRSGLAFFGKILNCENQSYSQNFINVLVTNTEVGKWRITGFYRLRRIVETEETRDLLLLLATMLHELWCVICDFNLPQERC